MKKNVLSIVLVIAVVVAIYYFFFRKKKDEKENLNPNSVKPKNTGVVNSPLAHIKEPKKKTEASKPYIVHSGDTLSKIAKRLGVPLKTIVQLNPQIKNINVIRVGQSIKIPV